MTGWRMAVVLLAVAPGCAAMRAQQAPPPAPVSEVTVLAEGSPAPDATALGLNDKPVRVADYRGKVLVLYFYPVDFASGSTALAQEFREDHAKYKKLGAVVVGVSTDDVNTHKDFAAKFKLPFPLLADSGGALTRAFGVPLEGGTPRPMTFVIDRHGVIRKVWPKVHPWGHHSDEVLAAIKGLR
jgi:thioredoxin-dependent peroxiredoxin